MIIEIAKATYDDALKANEFLTKLIQDEKKYDSNINEKFVINSYYEPAVRNPRKCLLIAKNDNEIIGYLYGYLMDDGDTVLNKVSKLDALFVNEASRRLKMATRLINEFKIWSLDKGCRYIEVGVFNSNVSAYNLYKNNGFKDIKTVMSLDLKDK
jgi:ribosomal protein S18 acetylase RimI-like enzyme